MTHDGKGERIQLADVTVHRDGTRILDGVDLDIRARRIAVIGENGSGKSTFARLLNGLLTPTRGRVTVHGLDTVRDGTELRRRAGFVFTDPQAQILMPTPREDLALSLRSLPPAEAARRVAETLAEHGLSDRADAPAAELSGGQKQLLALAAVLITGPALLIADEPTTLLDLRNARRIGDLLLSQPAQLVVITHDLELAARCDVALLFHEGRLVAQDEPAAVLHAYRMQCA
ncbi:energy-coupling factor ABC transporter ATP-binding protein [uncultured Microbacterium sp.]|uniref:energy-coupling factor ABC transporter ATP-binding protein n=1 Tax=uncultured Microbacterium sp. TaxID=191216 RepID=UPI0025CBC9CC|nr:ABC transporter ATP-binding protein [uncultured Microbacterium sp.]